MAGGRHGRTRRLHRPGTRNSPPKRLLITDDHGDGLLPLQGYFADIPRPYADLGEVVAGLKPGRDHPDERTMSICMGIAVDDAVTAGLVYERACAAGIGIELPL